MRRAARVVVIKDDNLLVIHRNKFGREYFTLPGGAIEPGEEPVQAALRELNEETTVEAKNPCLIFLEHADRMYGDQYVFLCDYVSGEPRIRPDSIEAKIHAEGKNLYTPEWLPLHQLNQVPLLSKELQAHLVEAIHTSWPTEPEEFGSDSRTK